jgi:hypothetical protein
MSVHDQPHVECPICHHPMPERWSEGAGGDLRPICNDCFRSTYRLMVVERALVDILKPGADTRLRELMDEHAVLRVRTPCTPPERPAKSTSPRPSTRTAARRSAILEELDFESCQTRNELRRKLKMNDDTCQRVLDELKAEGLIDVRPGDGKFKSKRARVWFRTWIERKTA